MTSLHSHYQGKVIDESHVLEFAEAVLDREVSAIERVVDRATEAVAKAAPGGAIAKAEPVSLVTDRVCPSSQHWNTGE